MDGDGGSDAGQQRLHKGAAQAAGPAAGRGAAAPAKKEETEDEYVNRRCEEYMHKSLSCRRGLGGKFYTIGGGGDGGVAYQVIG